MWPFGLLLLYVYTVASQVQRVSREPRDGFLVPFIFRKLLNPVDTPTFWWHRYPIQIFLATAKLLWGSEACFGPDKNTDGEIKNSIKRLKQSIRG